MNGRNYNKTHIRNLFEEENEDPKFGNNPFIKFYIYVGFLFVTFIDNIKEKFTSRRIRRKTKKYGLKAKYDKIKNSNYTSFSTSFMNNLNDTLNDLNIPESEKSFHRNLMEKSLKNTVTCELEKLELRGDDTDDIYEKHFKYKIEDGFGKINKDKMIRQLVYYYRLAQAN